MTSPRHDTEINASYESSKHHQPIDCIEVGLILEDKELCEQNVLLVNEDCTQLVTLQDNLGSTEERDADILPAVTEIGVGTLICDSVNTHPEPTSTTDLLSSSAEDCSFPIVSHIKNSEVVNLDTNEELQSTVITYDYENDNHDYKLVLANLLANLKTSPFVDYNKVQLVLYSAATNIVSDPEAEIYRWLRVDAISGIDVQLVALLQYMGFTKNDAHLEQLTRRFSGNTENVSNVMDGRMITHNMCKNGHGGVNPGTDMEGVSFLCADATKSVLLESACCFAQMPTDYDSSTTLFVFSSKYLKRNTEEAQSCLDMSDYHADGCLIEADLQHSQAQLGNQPSNAQPLTDTCVIRVILPKSIAERVYLTPKSFKHLSKRLVTTTVGKINSHLKKTFQRSKSKKADTAQTNHLIDTSRSKHSVGLARLDIKTSCHHKISQLYGYIDSLFVSPVAYNLVGFPSLGALERQCDESLISLSMAPSCVIRLNLSDESEVPNLIPHLILNAVAFLGDKSRTETKQESLDVSDGTASEYSVHHVGRRLRRGDMDEALDQYLDPSPKSSKKKSTQSKNM